MYQDHVVVLDLLKDSQNSYVTRAPPAIDSAALIHPYKKWAIYKKRSARPQGVHRDTQCRLCLGMGLLVPSPPLLIKYTRCRFDPPLDFFSVGASL